MQYVSYVAACGRITLNGNCTPRQIFPRCRM